MDRSKIRVTFIVEKLLAGLGSILGVGRLDDGVDRAGFLAKSAVDALSHVDIVASCSPRAIGALLGLDCDSLCRTNSLAQLAGNAPFLARGVPAKSVLATETGRNGTLYPC